MLTDRMIAVIVTVVVSATMSAAADLQTYRTTYDKNIKEIILVHAMELDKLSQDYRTLLDKLSERVTASGDLEQSKTVFEEIERFDKEKKVPEESTSTVPSLVRLKQSCIRKASSLDMVRSRKILILANKYDTALLRLQKTLTTQQKLDDATAVQEERARLQTDSNIMQAKDCITKLRQPAAVHPTEEEARSGVSSVPQRLQPTMQSAIKEDELVVLVQCKGKPLRGITVELQSHTFNRNDSKRTDRKGQAHFKIDPELEYALTIIDDDYEPHMESHCIGGEEYTADLLELPAGVKVIKVDRYNKLTLPGISPMQISGYSSSGNTIKTILVRPSSPRTVFSDNPPKKDQINLAVDKWITVTERSKSIDMKMIAPDRETRIVLYRRVEPGIPKPERQNGK